MISLLSRIFSIVSTAGSWIRQAIASPKMFLLIGVIMVSVMLYFYSKNIYFTIFWTGCLIIFILLVWGIYALIKWLRKKSSQENIADEIEATPTNPSEDESGATAKSNLIDAIRTIKTSKLGQLSGKAALYELPWYMLIGNSAAGKSTAIQNSGLHFPLDKSGGPIRGVGGTRNCDWFFSTEGIFLDTAGRYTTAKKDRQEWLDFLDLLKKHRSKAPINGVIVAASISDLTTTSSKFIVDLAKHLRSRVQEITEHLEVIAPVYIIFTKVDLLAGCTEFFTYDEEFRDRPWGATFPYPHGNEEKRNLAELFSKHFDELYQGLKELSVTRLATSPERAATKGTLAFPYEFAAIKPALETFIATFFEHNPYQYKPIFRGFYFTSALQTGDVQQEATGLLDAKFALTPLSDAQNESHLKSNNGFFLKDLFSKVILADKKLVRQYASPQKRRLRILTFGGMTLLLGLCLGLFSWSYLNNQNLVRTTQTDLENIRALQKQRLNLQTRFEALLALQQRIEQLENLSNKRPLRMTFGLYQGERLRKQLIDEYFTGLRQFMVVPITNNLESYLGLVSINPQTQQAPGTPSSANGTTAPEVPQTQNAEDAYTALKTYLMMNNRSQVEANYLTEHMFRFWRTWLEANRGNMPREAMLKNAQQLISFYANHAKDPGWPEVKINVVLVEKTQIMLRTARQGTSARDRVYSTIMTRSANRFGSVTVAKILNETDRRQISGNYSVPGTYTRQAWEEYIRDSFWEAANGELQTSDWVLGTEYRDDLTLEANPQRTFDALTAKYKTDYIAEWKRFVQGLSIKRFNNLAEATEALFVLGQPKDSPFEKLLIAINEQTSWDNPDIATVAKPQQQENSFGEWFNNYFFNKNKKSKSGITPALAAEANRSGVLINKEFSGIARILKKIEGQPDLLGSYLEQLAHIQARFRELQSAGDVGPGAVKLLQQTFDGQDSPISESMGFVINQLFVNTPEEQRMILQPLFTQPLLLSFSALVEPSEVQLNKLWDAQVYQPFKERLLPKYPFNENSQVEASPTEIAAIFGPTGTIAGFVADSVTPITLPQGVSLGPRTWSNIGITLQPEFVGHVAEWIAPFNCGQNRNGDSEIIFQVQPQPVPNVTEYTLEIDGQTLRYQNQPPFWSNFVWPNPQGTPGVKITAVLTDGRVVEVFNEPGRFGLDRLFAAASVTKLPDGSQRLSWSSGGTTVTITLRIISNAQTAEPICRGLKLPRTVVGDSTLNRNTIGTPR